MKMAPLDTLLYCAEDCWEDEAQEIENNPSLALVLEEDLFWNDEELGSMFSKEKPHSPHYLQSVSHSSSMAIARREAIEWILKVNAHYSFTALTAVLSVNYLDRFLGSLHFQRDKPWMTQLAAVACLSLAAKVEETQVPVLLDLQVEETKYIFEAKTIQRMELLVLSSLDWKMHPVTPLSFIDHIIRRLGLKTHQHWEFLRRCEQLVLSLIADSRYLSYLPSVVASATMLYMINQLEPSNPLEYQNQLMGVLKISKEKVEDCLQLILDSSSTGGDHKRKFYSVPTSPKGVFDATFSKSDSSSSSSSSSLGDVGSINESVYKKIKLEDQQMLMPSLNRVFVDLLSSP